MKFGNSVSGVILVCLLIGCGAPDTPSQAPVLQHGEVQWFEGDVEEAFASAKDSGKPVFLYWGAVWCPPCHNLKVNYFTKPEFVEAMRQFVPVYLDGDTERAQLWAERYGITGYPTVILFAPTGTEVFRMPSDVTAERYGELLEAVVSDFRPVHQILDDVISQGPESSSVLDLELIAFHSWVQDPHAGLTKAKALDSFWTLFQATQPASDRLQKRFMALTLEQAVQSAWSTSSPSEGDSVPTLTDQQKESLRGCLLELLNDPGQWADNKIFLTLQSRRVVNLLNPSPSPPRDELVAAWIGTAEGMQVHPDFSTTEQLMAFVPEFELAATDSGEAVKVSPKLQDKVRARVEMVTSAADDPGEFQSTLNMLAWLLTMAQLPEEAKALLDQHLEQTAAPHYFLSLLGDLAADNPETSLQWHRLAYEATESGASRVKWGSTYLLKLIEKTPEDADTIEHVSRELIGVLASADDAFAGRNYASLQRVDQALTTWADATNNSSITDALRLELLEQCDRFREGMGEMQFERCMAFLAPDPGTSDRP